MSWAMYHASSQELAGLAEAALRENDLERARELYRRAAEQEVNALRAVAPEKARTFGITAVSAASLWFKGHDLRQAEEIAHYALSQSGLPGFAREQLQELLRAVWAEEARSKAGVEFTQGEVLVAVSGGEVVTGGAPLELILRKVDEIGRLFFRTIEMLLAQPFRRHGAPSLEIQQQFRPWLFQAPPGSYQFAVRVEKPKQLSLFPDFAPSVDRITESFLGVVRAAAVDPEGKLAELVPNAEYREAFMKLTRNLTPTGKVFGRLEIRSSGVQDLEPIVLVPTARETINYTLRKTRSEGDQEDHEEIQLRGILRGLQLDQDWLEVNSVEDPAGKPIRIYGAGEMIDDTVGPMVNHVVSVTTVRIRNRHYYRDIQPEE